MARFFHCSSKMLLSFLLNFGLVLSSGCSYYLADIPVAFGDRPPLNLLTSRKLPSAHFITDRASPSPAHSRQSYCTNLPTTLLIANKVASAFATVVSGSVLRSQKLESARVVVDHGRLLGSFGDAKFEEPSMRRRTVVCAWEVHRWW